MAEVTRGPVGAAMWGGRTVDGTYPRAVPATPDLDEPGLTVRVSAVDLTSLALFVLALALIATGAGMLWGLGGVLLAVGTTIAPVAVLMGLGGDR